MQPEWAYKGDGSWLVAPEQPIELPGYAEDGGEEGEVAGLYVIGDNGEVLRVGFALGNEYSDHVMERRNYLYLAHSKLRQSSFGPEVLVGALPDEVKGTVRIVRGRQGGLAAASFSPARRICATRSPISSSIISNMRGFRRPGDVHIYYYGASALSARDGLHDRSPATCSRWTSPVFGRPLRNPLDAGAPDETISVTAL